MTPGDLYRNCKVSAHRLETLQHYTVPGDEPRQHAFHTTGALPPPGPGKQEDLDLIASLRQAGRRVERVHIVTQPITDYLRYELAVYHENAAAGETIRLADGTRPGLADLTTDFAIFDPETDEPHVILFDYDRGGQVRGYQHSQAPTTVTRCWDAYRLALRHSVALTDFAAGLAR
jgi:hypothetical protein